MPPLAELDPDPSFDLSGGALCLDFANTWSDRQRSESDGLGSYADLLGFAVQSGAVTAPLGRRLAAAAKRLGAEGEAALERVRGVRETIFRIFSARAAGRRIAETDLERLNRELGSAFARPRLLESGPGFIWRFGGEGLDLDLPIRAIVRSAAELLASEDLERVRECAGATCSWLFLDRSRGRCRRWCSMSSCGNRAKARRYYRRHRRAGAPGAADG